jgi:hypothetical protein
LVIFLSLLEILYFMKTLGTVLIVASSIVLIVPSIFYN